MEIRFDKKELVKSLIKSDSFCFNPFVQISTVPPGYARPCCFYGDPSVDGKDKPVMAGQNKFSEIWNCDSIKDLRRLMLAGQKSKGCHHCWMEEAKGAVSMRQRSFQEWGEDHEAAVERVAEAFENNGEVKSSPKYLELKPGNLCNLKCRICNQYDSNQIARELVELSAKLHDPDLPNLARLFDNGYFQSQKEVGTTINWGKIDEVWEEIFDMLPDLEVISLAGGEPPMLAGVHRLLRKCVETGHASHIRILISSNFTKLNPSMMELAKKFQRFEFIASIDGTEKIQEYIRHPSSWQVVSRNYRDVKLGADHDRVRALVNLTVSMNNILHFTDLLDWLDQLDREVGEYFYHPYNLNILTGPRYMSFKILPPEGRKIAVERIQNYLDRSPSVRKYPELRGKFEYIIEELTRRPPQDMEQQVGVFWRFTQIIDEHRGEQLQEADPILFEIVKEFVSRQLGTPVEGRL